MYILNLSNQDTTLTKTCRNFFLRLSKEKISNQSCSFCHNSIKMTSILQTCKSNYRFWHTIIQRKSIQLYLTLGSNYTRNLIPAKKQLMAEVCTVLILILIMSTSNATGEDSFSALRCIKTYLCSTMGQERLNNLMLLHIHLLTCPLDMS